MKKALLLIALFVAAVLAACGAQPAPSPALPSVTPSPSATASLPVVATATLRVPTVTPRPAGAGPVWEEYAAPKLTAITPIPPPATRLTIPDDVNIILFAGIDSPSPYIGRTDAITLVIYNARLARASVVSVPPDLFGYIPGYTMQRLYTAYPLGGVKLLETTIEYNLGVRPMSYAILNIDTFPRLIDDLGGINVYVTEDLSKYCPGIPAGVVFMDGGKALCYMRLRLGSDEMSRNRRQQEVIQTVFLRLVENGNLARLPELYQAYQDMLETNVSGREIFEGIPLALKLGDRGRVGFFHPGEEELFTWVIAEHPFTEVFLPNRPALQVMMQEALEFVSQPVQFTDRVSTLEAQLTQSPSPTTTYTVTLTPTSTNTPTFTITPSPTRTYTVTITPTRTITPSPTNSRTPTPSNTPTPSKTP